MRYIWLTKNWLTNLILKIIAMQRRTVFKQLVFAAGGVLMFPYCMQDKSKSSILLKKLVINGDQEKLMAELSNQIIPSTETPGAKDISAHLFVLMMMDDCYRNEEQQKFIKGLDAFETKSKKQFNHSFIDCMADEKTSLLTEIEQKKTGNPELEYFYSITKKHTIQAYTTSKYFLTKVQVYELVPGHFYGCVPVKTVS